MSIILDALKKAEKDRSESGEKKEDSSLRSLVVSRAEKSGLKLESKKLLSVALLIGVLGLFSFLIYYRVFRTPPPAPVPQPIAALPQAKPPPIARPAEKPKELRNKAFSAFKKGDYKASKAYWEELTLLTPTEPQVYNNLGLVLKKMGNTTEAQEAYEKALGLNPDYPEALNNLGVLYMEIQRSKEARPLFEKAIQVNPQYADAFFHLALLLEGGGNYTQAIDKFQQFLKLRPNMDSRLKAQVDIRIAVLKAETQNSN